MNTTLKTASLALASLALAACSASSSPAPEPNSETSEAMSITRDAYVTIRADHRKCVSPLCGGYWVRQVNRDADERYVSSLDFAASGLDDATVSDVVGAPEDEIVLRGKLGAPERRYGTRPFVVTQAWRGMPGVHAGEFDEFFRTEHRNIQCITAPCPNEVAFELNTKWSTMFDRVDFTQAKKSWVDETWLAARVRDHGALVTGSFVSGAHFPGGYEQILQATQVFVRLPDRVGPCIAAPVKRCPEGTYPAYTRNEDRCVTQTACVESKICAMYIPVCEEGYTLLSWRGESGCPSYACDPSFVVPAPAPK